jgi:electron transfer flavoprotein alpha subunit
VLGADIDALSKEISGFPVEKVYTLNHALLADYTPDGYTAALWQLIDSVKPETVVFPHTYQVRDYAPKLATRFGQALISDIVDVGRRFFYASFSKAS